MGSTNMQFDVMVLNLEDQIWKSMNGRDAHRAATAVMSGLMLFCYWAV